MLRIGITGGIGVGKTTVCQIFEQLGISVYYADTQAKNLYNTNAELKQALISKFGNQLYPNQTIDKQALGKLVFSNPEHLQWLNQLVHPLVVQHYEEWCKLHTQAPYTLKEAAILFESGTYKQLHSIIAVTCPLQLRIQRIQQRDQLSQEQILARIDKQMDQDQLVSRCQYILDNSGKHSLINQVVLLHHLLLNLAN